MGFIDLLELELNKLHSIVEVQNYNFGSEPLPLMQIVDRYDSTLPFKSLLIQFNDTHLHGLDPINYN